MRYFHQKYIQSYDVLHYFYNSFGIHKNPLNTNHPYEIRVFYAINDTDSRLGLFDSTIIFQNTMDYL